MKTKQDDVLVPIEAVAKGRNKSVSWVRIQMRDAPEKIPPFLKLDGKLRFLVPGGDIEAWNAKRIAAEIDKVTAA